MTAVSNFWHELNPVTRLAFMLTLIFLSFIVPDILFIAGIFLVVIFPLSIILNAFKPMILMLLKFLLPFCGFLFLVHAVLMPGLRTLTILGFSLNSDGIKHASLIASRITVMFSSFYLLFRTTHPEQLTKELVDRGLPWGPAYVINATLQMLPRMYERAAIIKQAQQARGLNPGGNYIKRIKAIFPLIGPLVFSALGEVEHRALSLELKRFNHNGKKTRLAPGKDSRIQFWFRWCCAVIVVLAGGIRIWQLYG